MKKDNLLNLTEEIQKWCETNEIICFIGTSVDEPSLIYNYEKVSNNDWIKFLLIAKNLNVKIIVIEKEINLLNTLYEDDFEILLNEEDLEYDIKKQYENALAHDQEIALIKLSFHYNAICYMFSLTSEWFIDYHFALEEVEELDDDIENSSYNLNSNSEQIVKRLTEQETEDYSRKVLEHEDFIKAKSRFQKEEIIKKILKDILGEDFNDSPYYYWSVIRKTEEIYEMEIKPKIEMEIKQKVLELKAKGLKKVEIRSKLDISQGMVDRFYHMD